MGPFWRLLTVWDTPRGLGDKYRTIQMRKDRNELALGGLRALTLQAAHAGHHPGLERLI